MIHLPSPEVALPGADMLVLQFNPVGSSVVTDGGRDAGALAANIGLPVLSLERPGSGLLLPHSLPWRRIRDDEAYSEAVYRVASGKIETAIHATDPERIAIVGRSAGALAALALATEGTLFGVPISHVYAAEPVGTYQLPNPRVGRRVRNDYRDREQALIDSPYATLLVRPEPTDTQGRERAHRLAMMAPHFAWDSYTNSKLWPRPVVQRLLPRIAGHTQVHIDFARTSMVLPQDHAERAQTVSSMHEILDARPGQSVLEIVNATTHRSFDKRSFFAARVVAALGIARPARS